MTSRTRFFVWVTCIYLASSSIAIYVSSTNLQAFRIELGASEDAFLLKSGSWGRAYRDSGPFRVRRGERYMTYFAARMAYAGAGLHLPVTSEEALLLRLRMHRYGEPGFVYVFGNGILLAQLKFREDSYPWDVREVPIDPRILRSGALQIELMAESTASEPRLPPGAIAGFDWIEIVNEEGQSGLRIATRVILLGIALPLAILLLLFWARMPGWLVTAATGVSLALTTYTLAISPAPATNGLEHLPFVFFAVPCVFSVMRWLGTPDSKARALTATFCLVLLVHSTVIFFPNHQPPDLGPHMGQIRFLDDERWSWNHFWEFASSFEEGGRGKPHFGAAYQAPYPPWTYFIVHGLRQIVDHPRFWLEMVGMVSAALMTLLTYSCASKLAREKSAPAFAFALMSIEISTWHHAARVHTPGLVGQVFFLAAVTYLAWNLDRLGKVRHFVAFALLSLAATIAYTATLFHFVIFMILFTLWEIVTTRKFWPSTMTLSAVAASLSGTVASFVLFYHHFVGTALTRHEAILAVNTYRAPASFLFLRNQMRDTLTILSFGYPLYTLLALPAYFRLKQWSCNETARRLVLAWTGTYILLLVLKDPALFPQLLLHVKEDLLFAPLMCILGGMTLAWSWKRGGAFKCGVVLVLVLFGGLQVRDYLYNADTIATWSESQRIDQ